MIKRFSGGEARRYSALHYQEFSEDLYEGVVELASRELRLGPYSSWDFLVFQTKQKSIGFWVPRIGVETYPLGTESGVLYATAVTLGYGLTRLVVDREVARQGDSLLREKQADLFSLLTTEQLSEAETLPVMNWLSQ